MNSQNSHSKPDALTPAHEGRSLRRDHRGLSTPVTHSLSIGITTVLIFGLVFAANGYLEDQQDAGARQQIETIGTELASQLEDAARLGEDSQQATLRVDQPATVMSNTYSVSLEPPGECPLVSSANTCLQVDVTRGGDNLARGFPVHNDTDVDVSLTRLDSSTFTLSATRTGGGSTTSSVIPMEQSLSIGIASGVDARSTGQVLNPFNRPPIAKFTFNRSFPQSGEPIEFNASNSRDPDGEIEAYYWHIDGHNVTSNASSETYVNDTGLSPGVHNVTLDLVDDEDGQSNETRTIHVSGLEQKGEMEETTSNCPDNGKCISFSVMNNWTNDWSDRSTSDSVTVSHLLINPEDIDSMDAYDSSIGTTDRPEIKVDPGDGWSDTYFEFDDFDDAEDGIIVPIDPVEIDPDETATIRIQGLEGGDPFPITVGLRYWVDDTSHRTIITKDN